MPAHHQSGLLNAAELARSLGVDGKTVASYLDLLVDLLLVRRLEPWHANVGKRLVKSPKVYVRGSGLTHALLRISAMRVSPWASLETRRQSSGGCHLIDAPPEDDGVAGVAGVAGP
jgi:predicted AAA+ superfamily ATPase